MKICNTEAMKLVREYEEQKIQLVMHENECSETSYKEGEEKMTNGYDYEKTRREILSLDEKVRKIRVALAKANCSVKVDEFGITIGEALVYLAQLQKEKSQLESLARRRQISRRITPNGVIEYTECLYDIEKAKADAAVLREKIGRLQMAIDRANLNNYIEV